MLFIINRDDEFFCSLKLCITTCKIILYMYIIYIYYIYIYVCFVTSALAIV